VPGLPAGRRAPYFTGYFIEGKQPIQEFRIIMTVETGEALISKKNKKT
jgi:hypothetical protein